MILYIIGLPGVGKTTFATKLSEILHYDWLDLDQLIADQHNKSILEIFEKEGESNFREFEATALKSIITGNKNVVVSTGGGTPCFGNNMRTMLDSGVCILLKDDIEKISLQILSDQVKRPMFWGLKQEEISSKLSNLWQIRKQHYEQTHIITGLEAIQKPQLLTNRVELFTKKGKSLIDIIEID